MKYLKDAEEFLKERRIDIDTDNAKHSVHAHTCPDSKMMYFKENLSSSREQKEKSRNGSSQLINWPVELALVNPCVPYFNNEEIVIAADCTSFSCPDFHYRFLKGRPLIIFCPKLDSRLDAYTEKLTAIFKNNNNIKRVFLVHMEVPCCFGLNTVVEEAIDKAIDKSERRVVIKEYTISIQGEIV